MKVEEVQRESGGTLGVLLTRPSDPYLESELDRRFRLFRLWHVPPDQSADFLRAHSASVQALVCDTAHGADASTIDLLPSLGIVSTFSVGLDKVDLEKCRERGIRVTNTPGVVTDDVADLAVGLAIAVLRKVCAANQYVRDGAWKRKGDFEPTSKFAGKSVGIVGLGRIGLAIAKRVEAFGCPVSYHTRSEKKNIKYKYYSSIVELATDSDILMVSCSATDETYHIVNREVMRALGSKGVLINIGRGSLVDEKELVSALGDGQLGGAGLDVFEHEPEPAEKLFELGNVVLLPHVGTSTFETCKEMADLVIANLEAYFQDKPLLTPVL